MTVLKRRSPLLPNRCSLLPYDHLPYVCARCGKRLVGRQTRWCSRGCQVVYEINHYWNQARKARARRDNYRCVKCGWTSTLDRYRNDPQGLLFTLPIDIDQSNWLEVNHRIPRNGRGYTGASCAHHQDRLETLCHRCHVKVTKRQRIVRSRRRAKVAEKRREALTYADC